ncbi:MAG TPA: hypothetical protein VFB23_00765 [Candidatus Acidoferrales bacterium]|jgi:hypothetical protein|nr:hypothetical protein [Candidatus Acidoferrales bacterium]
MKGNKLPLLGFSLALAVAVIVFYFRPSAKTQKPWNSTAITATYVGAQLRQLDSGNAALFLAYEVQNHTDSDYQLADGPTALVMSRLRADGSLSSQQPVRLSYPTFLPARQRARVALEIPATFNWPGDNDSAYQDRLRDFVNQKLDDVQAFVLFDQGDRFDIEFPNGWQELKLASALPR